MAEEKGKVAKVEPQKARALSPFDEMERLFDNFLRRDWPMGWLPSRWESLETPLSKGLPKVDLVEHDTEVVVRAEVPGIRKEDIDVTVTDDAITLRGEYSKREETKEAQYYRCELSSGSFTRTLALPAAVDSTKAKAKMQDGILELVLPKVEKSKRRTVEID